jgi:hypothetical protein
VSERRVPRFEPLRALEEADDLAVLGVAQIADAAAKITELAPPPHRMAVGYGDFTDTIVDLEAGIIVTKLPTSQPTLALPDGTPLRTSTLPKVEAVTGTRTELPELSSGFYAGLGRWLTANNAHISRPVRELFLQIPNPAKGIEPIVEVQFPIATRSPSPVTPQGAPSAAITEW